MDPASTYSIPPLLATSPTKQITLTYAGANVNRGPFHTDAPIRSAETGQLSIYGDNFSRVVIEISFEEDDLPILGRQVYYHYLKREDSISITDHQIEFTMNNTPSTKPDIDQVYTKALVWRIKANCFGPLTSCLERIIAVGHWRQSSPLSSLHADEDEGEDEDEDEDRSPTAVKEGTSSGAPLNFMDDYNGNSQQQPPHAQSIVNLPPSHMADQFDNSRELPELPECPHHDRISHPQPPPEEPQSGGKAWMVAVVYLGGGKKAVVQLVMPQEIAR
jgi:hypothetical protein